MISSFSSYDPRRLEQVTHGEMGEGASQGGPGNNGRDARS